MYRKSLDLALVVGIAIAATTTILFGLSPVLRLALGIMLVLVLPGYALVAALFFFAAGPALIRLLTTSEDVRAAAGAYLPWAAISGLTGALAFLMDAQNHVLHSRDWRGIVRRYYAMPFGDRYIWGVTAGIVRNLYERVYGA